MLSKGIAAHGVPQRLLSGNGAALNPSGGALRQLVTVGDNTERTKNEAANAKLYGVAPQPASSGRTTARNRLSRSRDRAANNAIHIVAIVRMWRHKTTLLYQHWVATEPRR